MTNKPLTWRQTEALAFMKLFITKNMYPPTIREIAENLNLKSHSTAFCLLEQLVSKGYIKKGVGPRMIQVVELTDKQDLNFGSYVKIEQKRFVGPNEMYLHKVIGRMRSNHYMDVPVVATNGETLHDKVVPVIACICCGVDETKVLKFRLEDVEISDKGGWSNE